MNPTEWAVLAFFLGATAGILVQGAIGKLDLDNARAERDAYKDALASHLECETDEPHPERWAEAPGRLYTTLSKN